MNVCIYDYRLFTNPFFLETTLEDSLWNLYYLQIWYFKKYPQDSEIQYIPRNMHTVFALLCFVVVIHWLIFPYPSGLLHWQCGNLTIAPVPAKQPWWIWINTSCKFIMNDCITTTKQSTTQPCAYFLGYTVFVCIDSPHIYGTWLRHWFINNKLHLGVRFSCYR